MTEAYADSDARKWGMFLHLSQFAGYLVPLAGFVVPIVIWQMKKEQMPSLDEHGRMVANWMISAFIYAMVSAVLIFVLIGIPMLWALAVLTIVFPIVGAIKAGDGQVWNYPMTIKFF